MMMMIKARDVKIRGRLDFEEDFDEIKDIISAKTMFKTDDHIQRMEEVMMMAIIMIIIMMMMKFLLIMMLMICD